MKNKILYFSIACIAMLLPSLLQAQGFDDGTSDAPVDGGLSLLIAAGAGYGIQKIRKPKSKNHAE